MKKIIIIIAAVIVVGGGIGAYFLFSAKGAEGEPEVTPTAFYTYALEDYFVTNVKDSNMLFKTTVILVANEAELQSFLTDKQYVIRDTILFRLRELTEDDIMSSDVQDRLRAEIPEILNKALDIDSIVSVYFSDFVMQ